MNEEENEKLTRAQQAEVTRLVNDLGEQKAAKTLGLSVGSLLRILARRNNVRRGTVALAQRSLAKLAGGEK